MDSDTDHNVDDNNTETNSVNENNIITNSGNENNTETNNENKNEAETNNYNGNNAEINIEEDVRQVVEKDDILLNSSAQKSDDELLAQSSALIDSDEEEHLVVQKKKRVVDSDFESDSGEENDKVDKASGLIDSDDELKNDSAEKKSDEVEQKNEPLSEKSDEIDQENEPLSEAGEDSPVKRKAVIDSDNDEDTVLQKKRIFGSDDEEDSDDAQNSDGDEESINKLKTDDVGDLMANIFGDDSDDNEEDESKMELQEKDGKPVDDDDDELKFIRVENDSEDESKEWDFDVMMRKKKAERKRKRKSKDGSILLITDADDQVKTLVDAMTDAANEDRQSNMDKRPAIQKRKMLPVVRNTLLKMDLFETLLDNGMMSAISEWLAPLPDKSLPALEVRSTLLKILQNYPRLDQGILKQSGLGKAVMFLFKHPKEIRENKTIAAKLIREWSRPIFQLDTDFRSLSREERLQRDFAHMPEQKRQRLSLDEDGIPTQSQSRSSFNNAESSDSQNDQALRPGNVGFIMRARVPKPSTRDYVIRPKPLVEGRFQGASKSRTTDRFDKAQREFRDRNRAQKAKRAVGVSIEGRRMDI